MSEQQQTPGTLLITRYPERFAIALTCMWLFWLPFMVSPITELLQTPHTVLQRSIMLAGLALFVVLYIWNGWTIARSHVKSSRHYSATTLRILWCSTTLLIVLSAGLTLYDGPQWLGLFVFTSAISGGLLQDWRALAVFVVLLLCSSICGLLVAAPPAEIGQNLFIIVAVSACTICISWTLRTNRELRLAREQLAHLAVTEERLRIARDLHDLLGHKLSLIVLKSELAGRLAATSPERAINEIHDIETAGRAALREARETIASYRQPTLDGALQGALEMLTAAGINCTCETTPVSVPASQEAVLAWTVREGVTNVIRHSQARHCTIRITQDAQGCGVTIDDDGPARTETVSDTGNGLKGLAERVAAHAGKLSAESRAPAGFRLCVLLPYTTADAARSTTA